MLNTPVLFLIFNRPDLTEKVFMKLRQVQPRMFYIAADGPRGNKQNDKDACEQTRSFVLKNIDWPCQVFTLFREENLGCKMAVSSAITWFFEHVEEGIILEDDCLPDQSFFYYCEELLIRYRNDSRINFISGTCLPNSSNHIQDVSYYFSKFSVIWGWATWKRVWSQYDVEIREWPKLSTTNWLLNAFYGNEYFANGFRGMFNSIHNGFDTWDFQLFFLNLRINSLNIHPVKNLISNVGFDSRGTHTMHSTSYAAMSVSDIDNIIHPESFAFDVQADTIIFEHLYKYNPKPKAFYKVLWEKVKFKLNRFFA